VVGEVSLFEVGESISVLLHRGWFHRGLRLTDVIC
jgi:hypothetical protein